MIDTILQTLAIWSLGVSAGLFAIAWKRNSDGWFSAASVFLVASLLISTADLVILCLE